MLVKHNGLNLNSQKPQRRVYITIKAFSDLIFLFLRANKMNMIKSFKFVAFWEGISLLLLFFIAMPLKYIWDMPQMVSVVGMAHGVLFLVYVVMAFMVYNELKWSLKRLAVVLLASIIPFGTFYIEKKYLSPVKN